MDNHPDDCRCESCRERVVPAEQRKLRNRRVHGWAFMDLTNEEVAAVRAYLWSGDEADLPAKFGRREK